MKTTRPLKPFEYISCPGSPRESIVMVCDVPGRLDLLKSMHIPELRQVVADPDVQLAVRKAAERTIRRIQKLAAQGCVCGISEKPATN
jgi:hypothetical protein